MIWIELSTEVEAEAVEPVAELFSRLGHGGVAIEEPITDSAEGDQAMVDPTRPVTVKTYLPEDDQVGEKVQRAEEALWHLSQLRRIEPLRITRLAEEDWAEAWKNYFFVQRIGERVVIKPSWREYAAGPDDVVLELDPGMAFGTGLHPTTRMCLRACEKYVKPKMRVLDLGTGSGILAIAAIKLGAEGALALDVDPVAVEVAAKNVALNGLAERIVVRQGSVDTRGVVVPPVATRGIDASGTTPDSSRSQSEEDFDLVLANIIARVLVDLSEGLRRAAGPSGVVVASGIIAEREEEVREALDATGLQLVETLSEGDWRTLVYRRV